MDRKTIARKKSRFLTLMRDFFLAHDYLEVETPLLSPFLLPEPAIEVFKTCYTNGYGREFPFYLIPSPELWMKRLVAEGFGNIFQITRCCRNGESLGSLHNPEFSMCEWYSIDYDYMDSLAFTEELCLHIAKKADFELSADITPPFIRISMKEAFSSILQTDLDDVFKNPGEFIQRMGVHISSEKDLDEEELFNTLFLTYIEPNLPVNKPVVLYDYPDCIPVLAKKKGSTSYYERWELYISRIETANCYTEETDPVVLKDFFTKESRRKKTAFVPHAIDPGFLSLFDSSFPACSGVALGLDRLFMSILNIKSIEGVILFPFSAIINK
jgi:elongation factor P--(R)-beta-lysine ligase